MVGVLVAVGGACGGTGPIEVTTVGMMPATGAAPPPPRQCSEPDAGYTLTYPAGWFTVEDGPVPCRFFHPEPFRLPARTEASWIAVNVQLAPVAFDEIVRSEGSRITTGVLTRREVDVGGRRGVRTVRTTSGAGLLPAGLRIVTWYVEAGDATLVGTTSEAAAAGTFAGNVEVLDAMIASAQVPRPPAAVSSNFEGRG